MRTVTLASAVPYGIGVLKAGTTIEVSDEQAEAWEKRGALHTGSGPTEQDRLQGDLRAGDLFIALQHGDADAIAEVQAMIAQHTGKPGVPPGVAAGGTPPGELRGLRAAYAQAALESEDDAGAGAAPAPVYATPGEEEAEDAAAERVARASGPPRVASRRR